MDTGGGRLGKIFLYTLKSGFLIFFKGGAIFDSKLKLAGNKVSLKLTIRI